MRKLTKRQEKYIRIMLDGGLTDINDMLLTQYNELISMNLYENVDGDIERFIDDHVVKEEYSFSKYFNIEE
jgi:hypothetical protein